MPHKKIRNIFILCQTPEYFQDVLVTASKQIRQYFKPDAYTLLVNGGVRQDVLQVHFHLNAEKAFATPLTELPALQQKILSLSEHDVYLLKNDASFRAVYMPKKVLPPLSQWRHVPMVSFDLGLESLDQTYDLIKRGFSLIFQEASSLEQKRLVIHVVAGGKLEVSY